jgi:hypothetical protein
MFLDPNEEKCRFKTICSEEANVLLWENACLSVASYKQTDQGDNFN